MVGIVAPLFLDTIPIPIAVGIAIVGVILIIVGTAIIAQALRGRHGTRSIAITATMDSLESYGRSVDGQLSTATVFVEVTAENRGTADVRVSSLRCELYRRRFGFWPRLVQTLPYFPIGETETDPLDWLLVANGLREKRSVIFSKRSDYPWSVVRLQPGETLRVRMVAVFSSGLSPLVIELSKIPVKGPYSGGSS